MSEYGTKTQKRASWQTILLCWVIVNYLIAIWIYGCVNYILRYCSKVARKKGFDDYRFMFWNRCKASEVEREIQEMREELNDFWQLAYELGERVPSSFVPDKSGN